MARPQSRYVCQSCGDAFLRWEGQCRSCGAWNSLVETVIREPTAGERSRARARASAGSDGASPTPLNEIGEAAVPRIPVGIEELDRVLGGGLVTGSLVLVGGEPGIGKSTLLLQAAAGIAEGSGTGTGDPGEGRVLYATGEESTGQVRLRAARLGLLTGPAGERIDVV